MERTTLNADDIMDRIACTQPNVVIERLLLYFQAKSLHTVSNPIGSSKGIVGHVGRSPEGAIKCEFKNTKNNLVSSFFKQKSLSFPNWHFPGNYDIVKSLKVGIEIRFKRPVRMGVPCSFSYT